MNDASPERVLEQLAFGENWKLDNIGRLISSVDRVQTKVQGLIDALPQKWEGETAELAVARFRVHQANLGKYRDVLNQVQSLVTGMSETMCVASSANTVRSSEAQRLLSSLPSGVVPSWIHDKVNQGAVASVPGFGEVDVNGGLAGVSNFFGAGRDEAAQKALVEMGSIILTEARRLSGLAYTYDPVPIADGTTAAPLPPFEGPSLPAGPGAGLGNLGGGPGGNGGPGGTGGNLDGPGGGPGHGGDGGVTPIGVGGGGSDDGPGHGGDDGITPIGVGDGGPGTYNPGGSGDSGGPRGVNGSDPGGSALRPALGAGGIGAVGLAAGAKLASGGGLAGLRGAFGGAGSGGLGGGGGLRGAASAAGSGAGSGAAGANSGMAGSRGAGRPGGMMMGGGGAGGSNDKKGKRVGLGYIAPALEDEGDGGPAANASRGGSRGGN